MKNSYAVKIFLLFVLFFISCSEDELKLEVYSPEAFAFQIDEEWELNASAQVKGFTQVVEDDEFLTKLSYYSNLITPRGELLEEVDYGMIDKKNAEELIDTQLEIQIILDSSFAQGEYTLQIFVLDDYSGQEDSTQVKFNLSE